MKADFGGLFTLSHGSFQAKGVDDRAISRFLTKAGVAGETRSRWIIADMIAEKRGKNYVPGFRERTFRD